MLKFLGLLCVAGLNKIPFINKLYFFFFAAKLCRKKNWNEKNLKYKMAKPTKRKKK